MLQAHAELLRGTAESVFPQVAEEFLRRLSNELDYKYEFGLNRYIGGIMTEDTHEGVKPFSMRFLEDLSGREFQSAVLRDFSTENGHVYELRMSFGYLGMVVWAEEHDKLGLTAGHAWVGSSAPMNESNDVRLRTHVKRKGESFGQWDCDEVENLSNIQNLEVVNAILDLGKKILPSAGSKFIYELNDGEFSIRQYDKKKK